MIVHVSIDEPVLPNWIYEKDYQDQHLMEIWFNRAQIHKDILEIEYLKGVASPWKAKYRMVNCSGVEFAL